MIKNTTFLALLALLFSCEGNKNQLQGTHWKSYNVVKEALWEKRYVTLDFYEDSVVFNLKDGDPLLLAELLGGIAGGKEQRYTWDYKVKEDKVILDPGFFGFDIELHNVNNEFRWYRSHPYQDEFIILHKEDKK